MQDDITFCADNEQCLMKDKCRRAEKPQNPEYASYSDFCALDGDSCEYFMKGRINE